MRRKSVSWLKDIVLTIVTATWLPIQAGMFLLGVTWDVMFITANFPTFERK